MKDEDEDEDGDEGMRDEKGRIIYKPRADQEILGISSFTFIHLHLHLRSSHTLTSYTLTLSTIGRVTPGLRSCTPSLLNAGRKSREKCFIQYRLDMFQAA